MLSKEKKNKVSMELTVDSWGERMYRGASYLFRTDKFTANALVQKLCSSLNVHLYYSQDISRKKANM